MSTMVYQIQFNCLRYKTNCYQDKLTSAQVISKLPGRSSISEICAGALSSTLPSFSNNLWSFFSRSGWKLSTERYGTSARQGISGTLKKISKKKKLFVWGIALESFLLPSFFTMFGITGLFNSRILLLDCYQVW